MSEGSDTDESEFPLPFGISAETGCPINGFSDQTAEAFFTHSENDLSNAAVGKNKLEQTEKALGPIGDVDPNDLTQTGWAVIFGSDATTEIKEALQALLTHRRAQTGAGSFKIFDSLKPYQTEESARDWLKAHGVSLNIVDPTLGVPYYLLIVASPESISFEFQYALDLYWAVGRVWFDVPEQFRRYADSVVSYETMSSVKTARHISLFAPRHDFDRATQLFADRVATPLVKGDAQVNPLGSNQGFQVRPFIGAEATKTNLKNILRATSSTGSSAILFSGSHGMSFQPRDPKQEATQGAIVCQDWGGYGSIGADDWFAATDVPEDAAIHGLIHFFFACYAAGYPHRDNFDRSNPSPREVAVRAMLSRLPQALLAHPNGGALAVIGHIDRAWSYSFQSGGKTETQGFRDVIGRLLKGERIGHATDNFGARWAALSTFLSDRLQDMQHGVTPNLRALANLWVARDDARNYIVLGDPAVRLRVSEMANAPETE